MKLVQFKLTALTLSISFGAIANANIDISELTINDLHNAVINKQITFKESMQGYLNIIENNNHRGPHLNSVITVSPTAIAEAEAADKEFKETGKLKPLQGIPVLLKDNINTANLLTTGGSISLRNNIPTQDAFIVKKLKNAGAIVIAKTNLHEFAVWGETRSSMLGQTLNPYDLTRTPGGSSGGTGAGVAANFGLIGIGTDTVNSIRSPASANSVVGLRPTIGLVSRTGIIPYSFTQDTAGPITRTVEDAAKVLNVIVAYDTSDGVTKLAENYHVDYTKALKVDGLKGKRIGVLNSFFGTQEVHKSTNNVVRNAIAQMKSEGATIIEINTPINADALVKDTSVHLYELEDDLNTYLVAHPKQKAIGNLKALIKSGEFDQGIKANIEKAITLSKSSDEYRNRLIARKKLQKDVTKLMTEQKLDALVFPHQKRLVVPIGEIQVDRNGVLSSVTGFPSIVVPAGFSPKTTTAPIGIPIGIEIFGLPLQESKLIEIAYGYEQNYPMRQEHVYK
ncbi:amidase family protein [Providencia sp. SP181]|uniref:amidase family protein n=1 Tax=Providencia sp. SP181 TaxID=3136277 RepID=UPI003D2A9393